ncbi:hypothetical protein ALQ58_200456 [Pseudomonas syringae pv. apii]|nr:hypothetical protein ALQ58_200456 [Pseudomonas syringae pv. apii]
MQPCDRCLAKADACTLRMKTIVALEKNARALARVSCTGLIEGAERTDSALDTTGELVRAWIGNFSFKPVMRATY